MNKLRPAYTVADSGGTYGLATPYAVVSTASGMPRLPAYDSKEAARQEADRLNAEAQRAATKITAAAQRKADRLQAEASKRDEGHEGETARRHDIAGAGGPQAERRDRATAALHSTYISCSSVRWAAGQGRG